MAKPEFQVGDIIVNIGSVRMWLVMEVDASFGRYSLVGIEHDGDLDIDRHQMGPIEYFQRNFVKVDYRRFDHDVGDQ